MAQKTATDNVVCISCGADVRSEALFCYNCGGAIAVHPEAAEAKSNGAAAEQAPAEKVTEKDADKIAVKPDVAAADAKNKAARTDRKPLTAAMLRRKRAYNRQPVEVVWQEPSQPSPLFVIASVVFTIFAAILLAAALYLK
jgi:hypothetical protein